MDDRLQINCCGCGLCAYVCGVNAIKMQKDQYGFLQPIIDQDACIHCGACEKVCIFKNPQPGKMPKESTLAAHRDYEIQMSSSSGGAFSAICQSIAEANLGNKISYYGAAWQDDFSVKHERVESLEEISRFRKSKYLQSDICAQFEAVKNDLNNGYIVIFSGTPCQIAAMNKAVKSNCENLYTIDIVCNGAGSPAAFQNYLTNKYTDVISVDMRHKDFYHGVIFYKWFEVICRDSRKHIERMNHYLSAYYTGQFNRVSCFDCPYAKKERVSDFTIGDIHKAYDQLKSPEYKNGVSVLLLNTEKANGLRKNIVNHMAVDTVKYQEIYSNSQRLREAGTKPDNYPEIMKFVSTQKANHDKYISERIFVVPMWKQKLGEMIPEALWNIFKK